MLAYSSLRQHAGFPGSSSSEVDCQSPVNVYRHAVGTTMSNRFRQLTRAMSLSTNNPKYLNCTFSSMFLSGQTSATSSPSVQTHRFASINVDDEGGGCMCRGSVEPTKKYKSGLRQVRSDKEATPLFYWSVEGRKSHSSSFKIPLQLVSSTLLIIMIHDAPVHEKSMACICSLKVWKNWMHRQIFLFNKILFCYTCSAFSNTFFKTILPDLDICYGRTSSS